MTPGYPYPRTFNLADLDIFIAFHGLRESSSTFHIYTPIPMLEKFFQESIDISLMPNYIATMYCNIS